jgi:3-dehydrosphinganine reductase
VKNDFYRDKVVVITGGSTGIGLAVAKEFAAQHAKLVLIARDEVKLNIAKSSVEKISLNRVLVLAADVSNKEAITLAINKVVGELGTIDVLINCAGITSCGRFANQSLNDLEKCLAINYSGAVYASSAAWQSLKKSKGQLSFVSSVAGYVGLIGYSGYAPSKFALTGLAECLWMEGKPDGIRVSVIYPPDTDTPLLDYEHRHGLPETIALSKNIKIKTPEAVAKKYLRGLENNRFDIYCDSESRMLRMFKTAFPSVFRYFAYRIVKRARQK